MSLVLLHLTDIHIRGGSAPILRNANAIAASVNGTLADAELVVVMVSGDVAFSGAQEQYAAATDFFNELRDRLSAEARCPIEFLVCPGNHDCDFTQNSQSRKNNILGIQSGGQVDESVIAECTRIQDEFFKFRDGLETWPEVEGDRLWRTVSATVSGKKVVLDALNVSWISNIREDQDLYFPVGRYESTVLSTPSDVRVVMFHHPLNWFSANTYRLFRKTVREAGSVVLTGHEHVGNVGSISDTESGSSVYVEGKVLQEGSGNLTDTGFYVLHVDLEHMKFTHTEFSYRAQCYEPVSTQEWGVPSARSGQITPSPAFMRVLADPGAIIHPGVPAGLTLQDIYVYPDLRKVHSRRQTGEFNDSQILKKPSSIKGGVILKCDERTGSTSLLYQLFESYLTQGFAPLIIRGSDIKRANLGHLREIVDAAIKEQYAAEHRLAVSQRSRSELVLLVDDVDESRVLDAAGRFALLAQLRQIADHLIVVVSTSFGLDEVLEHDRNESLVDIDQYEIQPLGYRKRAELVRRWVTLGGRSLPGEELIAECDKAERLIAVAMQKSLIPSAPLYLLILLQSISGGKSGDLKESSLGYYYEFLMTEALLAAGVHRAKLTEHHQYAMYLAWEFSSSPLRRLGKGALRAFNDKFSQEFFRMDLDAELRILLDARILIEFGDEYEFRYPYMYYHLQGRYLSANIDSQDTRDHVARCCNHLYVRHYANTILFLAHHENGDWLLRTMKAAMAQLFEDYEAVAFNGDTVRINSLISEAPALVYRGGAPEKHREERNRQLDARDQAIQSEGGGDGLKDAEDPADNLSLSSQIVMLIKTTEIIGQVLKNQYSTIRRPVKRDLLEALFDGSLRALQRFYLDLEGDSERLFASMRRAVEKAGHEDNVIRREKLARRYLADIVQSVSFAIVGHAAASVNAGELADDIAETVASKVLLDQKDKVVSYGYRLMELAVRLDSAQPIPRTKIVELLEGNRSDIVARRIITLLVLNRLYMFKTSESDMQWIQSKLEIPLQQQHQIAYAHGGRLLN